MNTIKEKIQLLEEQRNTNDPVSNVDLLNSLAYELRHTDTILSLQKSQEAIALSEKVSYQKGLAEAYLNQGFVEMVLANYAAALQLFSKATQILEQLKDAQGQAHALYNLSLLYRNIGDYDQALQSCQQSLVLRQLLNDQAGEAACLMQLGYINVQFGNNEVAYNNYSKSLAIRSHLNDRPGIAAVLVGIAIIEQKWQQYDKAEAHLLESLSLRKELGEMHGWLVSMNYLGDLYVELNKLKEAENIFSDALIQAKQHSNPFPANYCRLCTSMAKVYKACHKYNDAIGYLEKALFTAKEANLKYLIYDIYLTLTEVYKLTGDYQQALANYEQFHLIKEEVITLSAGTKLKNLELSSQIEAEKRAAEIHRLRHIELKEAYEQLQETQKQLIHAEKMSALGELTAGIAHEIQNPLNFVNNFSEVSKELCLELKEELLAGNPEEAGAIIENLWVNLDKIHHHGQRADSIVKGMLQHSRTSNGEKQLIDINALAEEYLRLSYHGLRAKDKDFNSNLITDFDSSLGKIEVVPQDLGRVLLNLFNNAFYATQRKKAQLNGQYHPEVKVSTSQQNGQVEIRVRDNGNGIPEADKNKIFQPFFTTKPAGQGTGLGLSLSYDIITKGHQGELIVESQEDQFSEFIIQLPL